MRLRHILLLLCALGISVASVEANTIPPDPRIIIVGGTTPLVVTGLTFSFSTGDAVPCDVNGFGSGLCFDVSNGGTLTWINLLFDFPTQTGAVSCDSTIFTSCFTTSSTIFFEGGAGVTPQLEHIRLLLIGWGPTTFNVQANIPEPATVTLFATGLGALLTGRALRRRFAPKKT